MIVRKTKGQICFKCGQFTKVFIQCECCKKISCKSCALNMFYCIDCFNAKNKKSEVNTYFEEKYANKVNNFI